MNKILITGLALGAEPDINACSACNYDLSWLFNNPSTLLWSDKIIITPKIYEMIKIKKFHGEDNDRIGEAVNVIFEQMERYDLIEIKQPSDIITEEVRDEIFLQIEKDSKSLCMAFPRVVKEGIEEGVPGSLIVEDYEYCTPVLWSLYAGLILSNAWGANIFYQGRGYNYFKYKFGIDNYIDIKSERHKAFDEIFSTLLPEKGILPNVLHDPKCKECQKESLCGSEAMKNIERNTKDILSWRSYDELTELRSVLNEISNTKNNSELIPADEIIRQFETKEVKLRNKINNLFPKIQHWSNIVTVLSVPAIVAGISTGSKTVASVAAGIGGLATVSGKYAELIKNKYRWLGFRTLAKK